MGNSSFRKYHYNIVRSRSIFEHCAPTFVLRFRIEKYEETKKNFREKTFPEYMQKIIHFMGDNKWLISDEVRSLMLLACEVTLSTIIALYVTGNIRGLAVLYIAQVC